MKHIHFIGICGVAMGGLAIAFKKAGWKVTGSDAGFFPPVSDYLKKHNIDFYPGWHPEKIGTPDLVVVSNVASSTNPEWQYVQKNKLNYKSYPEVIAEYLVKQNSIVCAGTYGKTTTSALLSWVLTEVGYNPSYMFGGIAVDDNFPSAVIPSDLPASPCEAWRAGVEGSLTHCKRDSSTSSFQDFGRNDTWSVLEGDEYKSARWDNSPKFSHYSPTHLILTAIEWDHADVYPTELSYLEAFKKLLNSIPKKGLLVISEKILDIKILNINNIPARHASQGEAGRQYPISKTYGTKSNCDYKYENIKTTKNGITFNINHNSEIYNLQSAMLGNYMAENITGVFAMAHQIGIEPEKIIKAIAEFKGLKRRLEKRYDGKITVFDDIAHSPVKAKFTLGTLRNIYNKKIIAVFEPNTGNRQKSVISHYDHAFDSADEVIIPQLTKIKIDPNKETPLKGDELAQIISKTHKNVKYIDDDKKLVDYILKNTSDGDAIVFLGSHGFRGMINDICYEYT